MVHHVHVMKNYFQSEAIVNRFIMSLKVIGVCVCVCDPSWIKTMMTHALSAAWMEIWCAVTNVHVPFIITATNRL